RDASRNACVTRRATGASQAPGACRRSPTPHGVEKLQTPGANAPRERDVLRVGLFDIVNEDGGHALASAGTIGRALTPDRRMGGAYRSRACAIDMRYPSTIAPPWG